MTYFDFYLVPVPRDNKEAYEELARISAQVLRECGALRAVECWLEESGPESSSYHADSPGHEADQYQGFSAAAGASAAETVVVSFAEWHDRAARDAGMEKLTADPRMQFQGTPHTFDGRRLIAGGFVPMLDESFEA